ncbi:MAG: hypothetical protein Q8O59_00330 [bacterium]|nr:hypothetical protein [bacterium]
MTEESKKINMLVEESGMITHFNATNILRQKGWSVLVSPYYHDSISDSIRETDLIAEKFFYSADMPRHSSVQINIQLFLECKYIKQEIVFWFDKIDKVRALSSLKKETGLTITYGGSGGGDILLDEFHYFNRDIVAKLFSTNSNKEDVIYKAMNQCLHSQIYYRQKGKRPIANDFSEDARVFTKIIQYPVIVCDNFKNLFEVNFNKNSGFASKKLSDHLILETNYREDYFLIDIVDINYLETFLINFEKEAQSLVKAYSFKWHQQRSKSV